MWGIFSRFTTVKEAFGQLWEDQKLPWARKFFDNWKTQLTWSRLGPYQKFAEMVERHWDGVVSYCHPHHQVSLGFMEGLNNNIRVIQRRSYGIRDMEYLRLKVLTPFIEVP